MAERELNLRQDGTNLVIEGFLPGVDHDDIEVQATRNQVTISGNQVDLPRPVDPDRMTVTKRNEHLKITLPIVE